MKTFKLIGISILVLMLTAACTDEEKLALDVEAMDTGAFLRTIELVSGGYDFLNIGTAEFIVTLEEGDAAGGAELESMDVYVSYRDGDGDDDLDEVLVKTIPASDFSEGEEGLPRYTLTVPALEAMSVLGLTEDDIAVGDQFRFRLAVNTTDGQTFSSTNSGGNVGGTFFNSPFRYNVSVACPLGSDQFAGTYNVTLVEGTSPGGWGDFVPTNFTATVNVNSSTQRSVAITYLPGIGGFAETLTFNFICTEVSVVRTDTGLACVALPGLTYGQGDVPPAEFDINDDSSFTLTFTDFIESGGCSAADTPYQVTLLFERP